MHPIAEDIHYRLPNQKYLEFVSKHILRLRTDIADPFAVEIPDDKLQTVYVTRGAIDKEISQSHHKIILGHRGSGKTTLWRRLHTQYKKTLIVSLPLNSIGISIPRQDFLEGKINLLNPDLLSHYIFNAYWENTLHNSRNRVQFLPSQRLDKKWMVQLRWFYHHLPPLHYKIPEEFELMAWLDKPKDPLFRPNIAPEGVLRELVEFVTSPIETKRFEEGQRFFTKIHILVDGTEQLSNYAFMELVRDIQRLQNLLISNLYINIFAESELDDVIKKLECVKFGAVRVYSLPEWKAQDIKRLLIGRLKGWGDDPLDYEGNWIQQLIPSETENKKQIINNAAKKNFIKLILNGSERAAAQKKATPNLPPQVHALKLARGFVAACAGCWSGRPELSTPLTVKDLDTIVDLYCEANKEETYDKIL